MADNPKVKFIALEQAFWGGRLIEKGEVVLSATSPGHWAAPYQEEKEDPVGKPGRKKRGDAYGTTGDREVI